MGVAWIGRGGDSGAGGEVLSASPTLMDGVDFLLLRRGIEEVGRAGDVLSNPVSDEVDSVNFIGGAMRMAADVGPPGDNISPSISEGPESRAFLSSTAARISA